MQTVIIGLPTSGKTTIFNALTGHEAPVGDHSSSGRQEHVAEVPVPDPRVDRLAAIYAPKKVTYATVQFRDPTLPWSDDANLQPAGLAEVRKADAVTIVVRAFAQDGVPHLLGSIDPVRDLRRVLSALVFADYEVVEKRLARLDKEGRRDAREHRLLELATVRLGSGALLGRDFFPAEDAKTVAGFGFLSTKPIFAIANTGAQLEDCSALLAAAAALGIDAFPIRGDMEAEIARLEPAEQAEFLRDLGIEQPARGRFLQHVYANLQLISFLTAGEPEVRAWSIREGTTASRAAGVIHTDIEKGFIRAEVARWEHMAELGGWQGAKKANKVRLEGKDYVMSDGDVVLFRFNV
jgi:GTP-binding protein YchF